MTTTATTHKELERRFLEEAFNEGTPAVLEELLADDSLGHTATPSESLRGRSDVKGSIEVTRSAFPDLALDLTHLVVEGQVVTSHWTATGTKEGELMGIDLLPEDSGLKERRTTGHEGSDPVIGSVGPAVRAGRTQQ